MTRTTRQKPLTDLLAAAAGAALAASVLPGCNASVGAVVPIPAGPRPA